MKTFLLTALFLTASLSSLLGDESKRDCEKFYVDSRDVAIENDQIYVRLDQVWVPALSISTDATGIYASVDPWHIRWICPRCTYNNSGEDSNCYKCGLARPKR